MNNVMLTKAKARMAFQVPKASWHLCILCLWRLTPSPWGTWLYSTAGQAWVSWVLKLLELAYYYGLL